MWIAEHRTLVLGDPLTAPHSGDRDARALGEHQYKDPGQAEASTTFVARWMIESVMEARSTPAQS